MESVFGGLLLASLVIAALRPDAASLQAVHSLEKKGALQKNKILTKEQSLTANNQLRLSKSSLSGERADEDSTLSKDSEQTTQEAAHSKVKKRKKKTINNAPRVGKSAERLRLERIGVDFDRIG